MHVKNRYRLTRLGLHFLFVAGFTMIGGALRGFNLLLVLSGFLVGALLVQWRCSRWIIESSSVERRLPSDAFAGVRFRVRYQVRNLSRMLPVWMIRIDDRIESQAGDSTTASCGVGAIGPSQTATPHYDCLVGSRGVYRFGPMQLSTSFPFSLFFARKIVDCDDQFHVFPKLLTLRKGWERSLVTKQGGAAAAARRSGPHEGDFFGLREWQTGDNPRWIHHRTTARVGEPIVRQFEQQRRFDACLLVDCYSEGKDRREDDLVETAISFAATIITSMDGSPANQLVMAIADRAPRAVICGRRGGGKRRMMQSLSEAQPIQTPDLVATIDHAVRAAGHTKDLVVISPRSLNNILRSEDEDGRLLTRRLQAWVQRGGLRWIHVADAQFRSWIIDPTNVRDARQTMVAANVGAEVVDVSVG